MTDLQMSPEPVDAAAWDPEAGEKEAVLPPPPAFTRTCFIAIAKLLVVATYVEDGGRLVFQWSHQKTFVEGKWGSALGLIFLMIIEIPI